MKPGMWQMLIIPIIMIAIIAGIVMLIKHIIRFAIRTKYEEERKIKAEDENKMKVFNENQQIIDNIAEELKNEG